MGWADTCPTPDDALTGIEIQYPDGRRSIITRDTTGTVREEEDSGGDAPYVYITENGVIETGYIDAETGARDRFTYSFATDDLIPLTAWSGDRGEQITTDDSGAEINRIPFAWRTRGATSIRIGDCLFASIPLETYYYEPGDPSMVEYAYLTDLGIPIAVGYAFFGGGIGSAEPDYPVSIRPAPKE